MRRDTRIKRDHVSAVSNWTPVGGAYGDKKTIRRYLALEAEFMQTTVPRWCQLAAQIQNEIFSEGFIDDEDILSYKLAIVLHCVLTTRDATSRHAIKGIFSMLMVSLRVQCTSRESPPTHASYWLWYLIDSVASRLVWTAKLLVAGILSRRV